MRRRMAISSMIGALIVGMASIASADTAQSSSSSSSNSAVKSQATSRTAGESCCRTSGSDKLAALSLLPIVVAGAARRRMRGRD